MSRSPTDDRATSFSISQIISALDDRNLLRAMRLLEPAAENGQPAPSPDRADAARCVRCITHGE
jgi:hypothetical protein